MKKKKNKKISLIHNMEMLETSNLDYGFFRATIIYMYI